MELFIIFKRIDAFVTTNLISEKLMFKFEHMKSFNDYRNGIF